MKYPRLHHDNYKNVKLKLDDIEKIKIFYNNGYSLTDLSKMYGVSVNTIKWHVNPIHRRKKQDYSNKRKRLKREANEDYRKYEDKLQYKRVKERMNEDPEFKKWMNLRSNGFIIKLFLEKYHKEFEDFKKTLGV